MPTLETANPESVGLSSSRLRRIDTAMQRYIDQGKIPGIQTLLCRRGQIVHQGCYGVMSLATQQHMRSDALFRIYSMTKIIASTCVMLLAEEGAYRLTDPIQDFFPGFKDLKVFCKETEGGGMETVPLARPITIHDLITHTSGLAYGLDPTPPVDKLYIKQRLLRMDETLAEKVKRLGELPLVHQPGERWTYSMGIDVLGHLVEVVSGKTLDVFMKERIFDPLGMPDTGFDVPASKYDRLAAVYTPSGKGLPSGGGRLIDLTNPDPAAAAILPEIVTGGWIDKDPQPQFLSGGGGLVSSAGDYLRFLRMFANKGTLNGERIMSRTTVDYMTRHHVPPEKFGPGTAFGYGMTILTDPTRLQSSGSVDSFDVGGAAGTYGWVDPQEELIGLLMIQMVGCPYPAATDLRNMAAQAIID